MTQLESNQRLRAIQEGLRIGIEELLARRDYARVEDILRALDRQLDPLIASGRPAPVVSPKVEIAPGA